MWRSFPFYPSHAVGSDLEVGVCYLELPLLDELDAEGPWAAGEAAEFYVSAHILCHGARAHAVPARTRAPKSWDATRRAFRYGEALEFPVKLRDLTRDAA
eukprot:CAMPEP_0119293810 /NCGR_PEP_ID=MMETSP1329-20130426/46764_1 /TAXON_ID=114041 /ORGANISM="Genus nov. species nov., Strain RCC1024" /LENGTH=99 /DNA_ID=CAMNT_0007294683 /DNA_START=117 /DNA_END=412 /DNA_ORIENTATION=+